MIKFIKKNHDENKIHQSRFDSLPLSGSGDQRRKSTFFNSSFISGNSYYNPDIKIDEYIGDSDTLTHEVVKLKSKGKSNAEISRQVGVSSTKVKKMLNKLEASIKGYDE
jgi:ATP/maltotriose-dependent transcriptional regulator MalT